VHGLLEPIRRGGGGSLSFAKSAQCPPGVHAEIAGELENHAIDLLEHALSVFLISAQEILGVVRAIGSTRGARSRFGR
jgi:uncharacterized protein (UPF0261 family)